MPKHYTGREEEASGLAEHLRAHGSLVLLGEGGMGKSSLAADVASRLVLGGEAPGGVKWVDLREAFSGADVETRFFAARWLTAEYVTLDTFICTFQKEDDNAPYVSWRYRGPQQGPRGPQQAGPGGSSPSPPPPPLAALWVVDNAEDALGEAEAAEALRELVGEILAYDPATRLLLTSRTSLQLPSPSPLLTERPVGAISPAAAAQLVQAGAKDVGEAEARRVAEVCQCVPLVLCLVAEALAAGRIKAQDLPKLLVATPSPSSSTVPNSNDASAPRVRLVLAALQLGYQQAFAQLSVFPSSFDEEAAAAVLHLRISAARGLLADLSQYSVVTCEERQRYSLHPLVREQAALLGTELCAASRPQVAAEGHFIAHMLRKLRGWADMYASPKDPQSALQAAREHEADVGKMMELLATGGSSLGASESIQLAVASDVTKCLTDDRVPALLDALEWLQQQRPAWEALLERLTSKGREEEAAGLAEHLRARGSLVLLAGGGVGKSCLAADVGWRLVRSGEVPGGALWVDLREAFSSADVEARFCATLGLSVEEGNGPCILAAVLVLAAGAQQAGPGGSSSSPPPLAALVVVDNAEDALGEAEAAAAMKGLVGKVLAYAPYARLLLTSRTSLHLPSPSPLLTERPVGATSPAAAAQLVQAGAGDVGEAKARSVAEACQCVPLVLCLVAEALVAGRMTVQDLPKLLAATPSPSSATVPNSDDASGTRVRLVLAGLKRQHQQAAALLSVFPYVLV
ncbi:hypothetical protein HYH03_013498 [Edaphochlamys debaryana]|uniref:Uncharacterized protein n=1 Tax=Edaphochlamys debaryana TaxID=47281 RepID=A0A836BUF5_9CHLO|nr:hypothetical protein HYH03_013498 [Edaphochlamys debaryana]|eukprot:KAG2487918.1 hypothetical protein HYH03_013498 [Edaphochlamys debaryana]